MTDRARNFVFWVLAVAAAALLVAKLIWPDEMRRPCVVMGALVGLFLIWRLVALTIRAFIQGINEGDDPRYAKRQPDRRAQ